MKQLLEVIVIVLLTAGAVVEGLRYGAAHPEAIRKIVDDIAPEKDEAGTITLKCKENATPTKGEVVMLDTNWHCIVK